MKKIRVEAWRIVKFLLITAAVNLPLALVNSALVSALAAGGRTGIGAWLTVLNWVHILINMTILTLLHRVFTFRATEKWYIALPIMVIVAIAWQLLKALPLGAAAKSGQETLLALSNLLSALWLVLQYLLQRCVIYCHTTDTNGWYARFHQTNEE